MKLVFSTAIFFLAASKAPEAYGFQHSSCCSTSTRSSTSIFRPALAAIKNSSPNYARTINSISRTRSIHYKNNKDASSALRFQPNNGSFSLLNSQAVADMDGSRETSNSISNADDGTSLDAEDLNEKLPFYITLWRFTRPHTLIGSALAIPALHTLAAPTFAQSFTYPAFISTIYAMLPSLLMNLYITGLNQITDVDIDKINKPNLPIAAGDLSMKNAIIIVTISLILSLLMGAAHPVLGSKGLNIALWGSGILGTMYSLPPFRLKRFPLLAAFCIVAVRGTIINAGFFAHAKAAAFGGGTATGVLSCLKNDVRCLYSSLFFAVFGIVIALMKDVPDAVGDKLFNIKSFTVRIGQKTVFHSMRRLLFLLFLGVSGGFIRGAVQATTTMTSVSRAIVAFAAFMAGTSVRLEARVVNPEDSSMVYQYYMHLWKLFYLSYLVLPFAR